MYSDYIIRGNELKEYASFPLVAERENSSYTEPWPLMQWTLADEQQTILGHRCQKATCRFRGRDFIAWFVQKIYVWEAVAIEQGKFFISQYPDKLYPKSTRKSVWQRQKLYNEDYWRAIGWTHDNEKVPFEQLEKE